MFLPIYPRPYPVPYTHPSTSATTATPHRWGILIGVPPRRWCGPHLTLCNGVHHRGYMRTCSLGQLVVGEGLIRYIILQNWGARNRSVITLSVVAVTPPWVRFKGSVTPLTCNSGCSISDRSVSVYRIFEPWFVIFFNIKYLINFPKTDHSTKHK